MDAAPKTDASKRPFSAIRVVECGSGISAAFATKMLADLGADVIKVEQPDGDWTRRRGPFPDDSPDPEKSALFAYLNINKRGVVADLTRAEGREMLASLLERADILIHNVAPREREAHGLQSDALCATYPHLVVTSLSMFGDTGPRAQWHGYELNAANAGGWAYLSPGASPHPELPPLKAFGHQCDFQAGVHGATVSLAAYRHRRKTGQGQAIDVSEQECVGAMLEMNFMHYTYAGRETSRLGQRALGPWFIADCADGKIFLVCVEEAQWQRLVELMGHPEWAKDELFKDRVSRAQNLDALKALMTEWLAGWKVEDLYRKGQGEYRVPFAPVNTMRQMYENGHLAERGFFRPFEQPGLGAMNLPGPPSKYSKTHWELKRPAPRLGEHGEQVFVGELGLPRERFESLRKAGVA